MPERWIVDAMNVIGSRLDGWWKDRNAAMRAFASAVDDHARETGKDTKVVFDSDPGPLPELTHIQVVIARRRGPNAADQVIEELVAAHDDPARLRIVTSDRALIETIKALGAEVVSSGSFRAELEG